MWKGGVERSSKLSSRVYRGFREMTASLRISRESTKYILNLIDTLPLLLIAIEAATKRFDSSETFTKLQKYDGMPWHSSIDYGDPERWIENKYIVYVKNDYWDEHYKWITRQTHVEVFSDDGPINTYYCTVDYTLLSVVRRMPEVVHIEQDQFHSAEDINLYAGYPLKKNSSGEGMFYRSIFYWH